jgi:predicted RNA-binding Zn-ribbon protein involved in translation (DUF1610 family)
MFKNLIKTLDTFSQPGQLTFDIEADDKGYVDHECPDPRCMFRFKVRPRPGDANQPWTCPMCGHEAPRTSFYTTEQVAQAKEMAIVRVRGSINQAMRQDARDFNSRQRGGFLKMSMHVSGTEAWQPVDVPISATEAMQLEIVCAACQAEYAVVGAGFFCPLCGNSSAARVFDDALRKISAKRDHIPDVRAAIEATAGKDQAELVARSLIETCLLDGVVAFQRFCEVTYRQLPGVQEPPFNAFQRLNDGSKLWKTAIGQGYEDWISPADLETLKVLFQRRHLMAHSDGVVDQKYLATTADTTYKEGQRIVVTTGDVDNLVRILSELGAAVRVHVQ